MAHYAFLDENDVVTEVIVGVDETQLIDGLDPETWYGNFRNQTCKRTSYNNRIRKQFAAIGYIYNPEADVFIAKQPYPSWSLDAQFDWQAPKSKPEGEDWFWDEELGDWVNGETV